MAAAFDLIDENNDGLLSRRELWRFIRSFVSALIVLSGENFLSFDIIRLADNTALYVCDTVFEDQNSVSFDDLADWYSSTGYRVSPWMELLDMSKWKHLMVVQ